jgi:uncharacterized membrane protein required for colicin V production
LNILDPLIVAFLLYFLVIGFYRGFIRQFLDLIALIVAFVLAFKLYQPFGMFLINRGMPQSFANVAGFFIVWFIIEFIYYFLIILFYERIPLKIRSSEWNKWTGAIPAFFRGIISLWVILGLFLILPLPNSYRNLVSNSLLGRQFIKSSSTIEKYIGDIFGGAIEDTINFLTIKPESNETIDLGFKTTDVKIDYIGENQMLVLINKERTNKGLKALKMDEKLQEVARAHGEDMFARGYFAHNTPEGKTPFDRMNEAGIKYVVAGENLALAPNLETAHQGLMDSKGHRENILSTDFGKVGIGVIDGGKYGEIFVQEFTN